MRRVIEIIDEKMVIEHVYPDDGGHGSCRRLSDAEARPFIHCLPDSTDGVDPFNGASPDATGTPY